MNTLNRQTRWVIGRKAVDGDRFGRVYFAGPHELGEWTPHIDRAVPMNHERDAWELQRELAQETPGAYGVYPLSCAY